MTRNVIRPRISQHSRLKIDASTLAEIQDADSLVLARFKDHAADWLDAGILIFDDTETIRECNGPLRAWLAESEVVGASLPELFARIERPEIGTAIHELLRSGQPFSIGECRVGADESAQWFQLELSRSLGTNVLRLNSVLPGRHELSEGSWNEHLETEASRRSMFLRMMQAESRLENLLQRWPGVIFTQRPDFTFEFVTPRISELTGIPVEQWHRQSKCFWESVHEADVDELRCQLKQITAKQRVVSSSYRIRNKRTGKVSYIVEHRQAAITENGLLLGYEGVWLDITRQAIAEKRLSSAAWKETLAVLTMGLAHDFSNIMAGILALSESFEAEIAKEHPFQEGLRLIQSNAKQASQLVQRILNLHQGKTGERSYHSVNDLVTDLTDLIRKIIPRRIHVEMDLCTTESLPLYVDPVEFRQVFINLALNAADAMPGGGSLRFATTRRREFGIEPGHVHGSIPRLPAVCIDVTDTGTGIPARLLSAIFDPFFTTKATNKGSGLGLYNARLFVDKHNGAISVESEEGVGSTFRVWLPETDFTELDRATDAKEPRRHMVLVAGQSGKMLDTIAELLRRNGFYVVLATSEESAAELLFSSEYSLSALLMLASGNDTYGAKLLREIRSLKIPIKTVLQVLGKNQDEVDTEITSGVDLLIASDAPPGEMIARLKNLIEES